MTDDKSPGAIRSGLLVISHLSLVICHFESGGLETLELRVLIVKWSKIPLRRFCRFRKVKG